MNKKEPTIKDVARLANVGITTVSRVLNNSGKVHEKTRTKILKIIDELGYVPNMNARFLSSKKSYSLSFVAPDVGTKFFGIMYTEMEKRLSLNNYRLIYFPLIDDFSLQMIKRKTDIIYHTDAVFLASIPVKNIFKDKIPTKKLILMDSKDERFDSVYVDNYKIGQMAAEYLLKNSDKDTEFYLITFKEFKNEFNSGVFEKRGQGFIDTIGKEKVNIFYGDLRWNGGYKACEKLFKEKKERKIAVFTISDIIGYGTKIFFDKNGYIPNKDYNLISTDDLPQSKIIGLTTIKQPIAMMAKQACELFFSHLNGRKNIKNIELEAKLLQRES